MCNKLIRHYDYLHVGAHDIYIYNLHQNFYQPVHFLRGSGLSTYLRMENITHWTIKANQINPQWYVQPTLYAENSSSQRSVGEC